MSKKMHQHYLSGILIIALALTWLGILARGAFAGDDAGQPLPVTNRMFLPVVAGSDNGVDQQEHMHSEPMAELDDPLAEQYDLSPLQLVQRVSTASIVPTGKQLQILLPLYIYPNWYESANYVWDDVAATASQTPITAIINPCNGPANNPPNDDYVHGLNDLRSAGVTILGYVSTNYGNRPIALVKADIKVYNDYFNIDGIFLDEASTMTTTLSYYTGLYNYVKRLPNLRQVVLNPGTNTDKSYFSRPAADAAVVFESPSPDWFTYTPDSYVANFAAERFAMLAHEVPNIAAMQAAVDLAIERNVGYVYLTDDLYSPNPWDTLPTYWVDEVAYIAQQNAMLGAAAGVQYEYYEGTFSRLPDFTPLTPLGVGVVNTFDLAPRNRDDLFAFRFNGCIQIPVNGRYTFFVTSDAGSKLYINGVQVVNNDGLHISREKSGAASLSRGRHRIQVTYFEKTDSEVLTVQIAGPGLVKQVIPLGWLSVGC
jgi:hypothetical protein